MICEQRFWLRAIPFPLPFTFELAYLGNGRRLPFQLGDERINAGAVDLRNGAAETQKTALES